MSVFWWLDFIPCDGWGDPASVQSASSVLSLDERWPLHFIFTLMNLQGLPQCDSFMTSMPTCSALKTSDVCLHCPDMPLLEKFQGHMLHRWLLGIFSSRALIKTSPVLLTEPGSWYYSCQNCLCLLTSIQNLLFHLSTLSTPYYAMGFKIFLL